jgi:hypothetical protein
VRYLELLQEELYSILIDFDFDLSEVIFQQNNASVHKAKKLCNNSFRSNHTLLWTGLLNH